MRKLLVLALACVAIFALAQPAYAVVVTEHCKFDHQAMDDPIVFPGQPGASHLHNFGGSRNIDAFSTPESLLAAANTLCDIPTDYSGYWTPVIYVDGVPIHSTLSPYWSMNAGIKVEVPPFGLSLVTDRQWGVHAAFACTSGSQNYATIPDCTGRGFVKIRVIFPTCWNGIGATNADVVYGIGASILTNKVGTCPAGFTHRIPRLLLQVNIPNLVNGVGHTITLASGDYTTMHADWMDAFTPAAMQVIVDRLNA